MAEVDQPLDEHTHRMLVRTAHALIAIVGVIVLVVSSYYLRRYAINTGMPEWLAWTLFVALDAGGTAGTLCWLLATGPARTWGRAIALANLTGSLLGNILGHLIEAGFIPVTPLLVILTGGVYPAELWALVHLGILLRQERVGVEAKPVTETVNTTPLTPAASPPAINAPLARAEATTSVPQPIPPAVRPAQPPTPIQQPPRLVPPTPPRQPTRAPRSVTSPAEQRRQAVIRMLRQGHLSQTDIATQTGMSLRGVQTNAKQLGLTKTRPRREQEATA